MLAKRSSALTLRTADLRPFADYRLYIWAMEKADKSEPVSIRLQKKWWARREGNLHIIMQ